MLVMYTPSEGNGEQGTIKDHYKGDLKNIFL